MSEVEAFDASAQAYCLDQVVSLLKTEYLPEQLEPPVWLWSNTGCRGRQYPSLTDFPTWDEKIDAVSVGFSQARSLFVPPHAELRMWGFEDGYTCVPGPALITDTDALLQFWTSFPLLIFTFSHSLSLVNSVCLLLNNDSGI